MKNSLARFRQEWRPRDHLNKKDQSKLISLWALSNSKSGVLTCFKGYFYLKKWAKPGLFFVYFCHFKQKLQFFQQIYVKNVHPVYGAGIRTMTFRTRVSSHNH